MHHQICNFSSQKSFLSSTPFPFPPIFSSHRVYVQYPSTTSCLSLRKNKTHPSKSTLKRLTSRVVQLTRRKQLHQVFQEIEVAKRTYGGLNTIVMNAVLEACVHCGDIDSALKVFDEMSKSRSCRVDNVSYATLLKLSWSPLEFLMQFKNS